MIQEKSDIRLFAFVFLFSCAGVMANASCDADTNDRPFIRTESGNLVISGGAKEANVDLQTCGSGAFTINGKPFQTIKGEKGSNGTKGGKGESGTAGIKGQVGAKGDKGEAGSVGPKGAQGLAGSDGGQGKPGPKGDRGERGTNGTAGIKGDKGEQGIGKAGSKGEKGTTGTKGAAGQQGPPGGTKRLNDTVEYLYREVGRLQSLTSRILDCNARGLLYDSKNDSCKEANVWAYSLRYTSSCAGVPRKDSGLYSLDKRGLTITVYCDMTRKKSLGGNGKDQITAAVNCAVLKQHFNVTTNGRYWIDPDSDAENTSNAVESFCLMSSATPATIPASVIDDGRLINFYVFSSTTPNVDLKKRKNLSINSKYYRTNQGLDVNGIGTAGAAFSYSDQTIIIVAQRNFGLSGTSGMIFQTSNGDDGITIRNDFMGGRTHTSGFELHGTKLSNLLPKQGVAAPFGLHLRSDGVEFWTETAYFSPTKSGNGGPFDSLSKSKFVLGSGFDSWRSGSFVVRAFLNYNQNLSKADVQKILKSIKNL